MVFNNFRLQIILRVIGITISITALAWSIVDTEFLMTPIVFGLVTVLQIIALIKYNEWILRELKRFLDSFIDRDYTRRFEQNYKGKAFRDLGSTFNQVVADFEQIRIEKEEHYQYLLQVNEHVNVGLICFKEDGRVDLMNAAACELLNQPRIGEIKMIKNRDVGLFEKLNGMKSGDKILYAYDRPDGRIELAIAAGKFRLGQTAYTLLSFQNIHAELDAAEMQAWQKLIRVLTHEIMNSVTPVVSLTTAVKMIMEEEPGKFKDLSSLGNAEALDIYKSINAIESRGKGLLKFVNAYRDYTKVPELELEQVDLVAQINGVLQILKEPLRLVEVSFEHKANELFHELDSKLIDQVLINLIKNALEAMEDVEEPSIEIQLKKGPIITIRDYGPGIPEEIKDEIFVPFFTTKKQGNGIGLSLSKQIMKAHKGDITVESNSCGTTFTLKF